MKTTKEQIIADITAKVEAKLSIEKVELGFINDANNIIKSANVNIDKIDEGETLYNSTLKQYESARNGFIKADSLILSSSNKLDKDIKDMNDVINKIKKSSADLGVNYNDIKEYKTLEQTLKIALQYSSGGKKISSEIRNYIK